MILCIHCTNFLEPLTYNKICAQITQGTKIRCINSNYFSHLTQHSKTKALNKWLYIKKLSKTLKRIKTYFCLTGSYKKSFGSNGRGKKI